MQGMQNLAAWHVQGRASDDIPGGAKGISDDEKVKAMIDSGYSGTRAHIDRIRNEIEVQRL